MPPVMRTVIFTLQFDEGDYARLEEYGAACALVAAAEVSGERDNPARSQGDREGGAGCDGQEQRGAETDQWPTLQTANDVMAHGTGEKPNRARGEKQPAKNSQDNGHRF